LTIQNFTARDIAATSVAFVLLGLFLVVPGYVVGSLLDVFSFHRRSLLARLAIAISLSVAVVPILTYLNWRWVPAAPWAVCAAAWAVFPVLLARYVRWPTVAHRRLSPHRRLSKERKVVLAIVAGWIVVGTLCLVDMQIGNRLYFHVASLDYTLRAAFTAAIARTGVPPLNPFFYPGHGYVMRYHYFWYMLGGLVDRFGGALVTGRIAVIAGALWSGIALLAVVSLYARFFRREMAGNRDRQVLVAVSLLSVTGLDIVPNAMICIFMRRLNATSEWWNEQVTSWINSVFWEPHTIVALVACATGLLVVWDGAKRPEPWVRISSTVICGVAFASAFGLSIYVTFVYGVFLAAWVVTLFFRGCRREATMNCMAGILALLLASPYLVEVLSGGGSADGKAPISFAVRAFYIAEALVDSAGPRWHTVLADTLALPLNYFLEFGFFFVVGIKQWKRIRQQGKWTDEDAFGMVMLATSLIICSFFRSNTIANNDLGWRSALLAQFVLLIWAADLWEDDLFPVGRRWSSAVGVMLILGAAPIVYDVTMLRIYPVLSDDLAIPRYNWLAADHKLGERTFALRQTYERLGTLLPKRAIVQQNPNAVPEDLFYGLYADRQMAAEGGACGTVFGGPPALCPGILMPINELFSPSAHLSYTQVEGICRELSIDTVVVKDTDGIWGETGSWVWKTEPLIANGYSRAFLCGAANVNKKNVPLR
jgi:hypothetical protein